ncbi:MAG: ion channel [Candidatus Tectomicrobia bacterium]|nr:ion channel [Candidatus Tectomicrobia bacterium]
MATVARTIPEKLTPTGRFRPLFLCMLVLHLLYPYIGRHASGELFLDVLVAAVLVAAIYAVSIQKQFFRLAGLLGFAVLVTDVGNTVTDAAAFELAALLCVVPFYVCTTLIVFSRVLTATEVTSDTLYGAVCVYMLMALTWAGLYMLIEWFHPASFYASTASSPDQALDWSDLFYFSYTTLTTLGYGDITPVTSAARSMATLEAACGVLYTAILVARLVGMHQPTSVSHDAGPNDAASPSS